MSRRNSGYFVSHPVFGLSDEYTFVPNVNSVPGEDRNNVMNMKGSGTGNRFRYNQWKTINKN